MQAGAIFNKHQYTFDVWAKVYTTDILFNFQFVSSGKGTIVSGTSQTYLYTPEPVMIEGRLENVKDSNGTLIFTGGGDEYYMYVNECEPVVNVFGRVVGYRSVLRRSLPNRRPTAADTNG